MELGAGTGVINEASCRRHPDVPVLAVELDEAERESRTVVLVSSLPFRSLPAPVRMPSSVSIERLLIERPGCRPGQYAYLPGGPVRMVVGGSYSRRRPESVWRNVLPA